MRRPEPLDSRVGYLLRAAMGDFDQLIRFETANSAVAFRDRAYDERERHELLRDLVGLANASVSGPRYLVVGVTDAAARQRAFTGVSGAAARRLHELGTVLANEYIDPPLMLRIDEAQVDGARVVVIVLPECHDPPYLLRRNASASMRAGSGWIRQGRRYRRLVRDDLERIFRHKLSSRSAAADLRIGFAGHIAEASIELPVMRLEALPSQIAGNRFRRVLEAKRVARQADTKDRSHIERLVHAQVFGPHERYVTNGTSTFVRRLRRTSLDYEVADCHYAFETRAHKVNLVLENLGSGALERGTLTLDFPRLDGVEVPERLWLEPETSEPDAHGYPRVDTGARTIRVQTRIGPIPPGAKFAAFREPLRLCLREAAIGKTIPVIYSVHSNTLRAPQTGSLTIDVVDDRAAEEAAGS